MRAFLLTSMPLAGALTTGGAWAQSTSEWPARAVTVPVGFTAGGPTDVVAGVLAGQFSARFNQSFMVDNNAGAFGWVAATLVKKAALDGYTLMFGCSGTLSIAPNLQKNLGYDLIRDFTPISLVASYPYFLVVPSTSTMTTFQEFLKKGRDPAANLTYASAGNGAVNHLAGEWFKAETGVKSVHVPYGGDSATVADLVGGRVDWAFLAGAAALPEVKAGKMCILASASPKPGGGGKGLLTLGEARYKGVVIEPWNGLMAPAHLPQPIVTTLNTSINEIMNRKDFVEKLASMEQYPLTGTPQQFTKHIKEQTERWGSVIKTSDIKAE